MGDLLKRKGKVRTDLYCNECSKNFIAELNFDIDGNHVIECPYCSHEHCRVIKSGIVTSDRWDTRVQRVGVEKRNVWKHDSLPAKTSAAGIFLRDKWLNLGE